jgi:hypothetical protein
MSRRNVIDALEIILSSIESMTRDGVSRTTPDYRDFEAQGQGNSLLLFLGRDPR